MKPRLLPRRNCFWITGCRKTFFSFSGVRGKAGYAASGALPGLFRHSAKLRLCAAVALLSGKQTRWFFQAPGPAGGCSHAALLQRRQVETGRDRFRRSFRMRIAQRHFRMLLLCCARVLPGMPCPECPGRGSFAAVAGRVFLSGAFRRKNICCCRCINAPAPRRKAAPAERCGLCRGRALRRTFFVKWVHFVNAAPNALGARMPRVDGGCRCNHQNQSALV